MTPEQAIAAINDELGLSITSEQELLVEDVGVDSLTTYELLSYVEELIDDTIPDGVAESWTTVADVVSILCSRDAVVRTS